MKQETDDYAIDKAEALLTAVAKELSAKPWFKKGNWRFSVHHFPPAPAEPESVTMHVYRSNWMNEDRQGIHFETSLSSKVWKEKKAPLMMHIFHHTHVPGTSIKRIKVSQPFIDKSFDIISSWNGYKFRAGKYGTHPFTKIIPFDESYSKNLCTEFERMCLSLGPLMDEALNAVL